MLCVFDYPMLHLAKKNPCPIKKVTSSHIIFQKHCTYRAQSVLLYCTETVCPTFQTPSQGPDFSNRESAWKIGLEV